MEMNTKARARELQESTSGLRRQRLIKEFEEMNRLFQIGGVLPIFEARYLVAEEFGSMKDAQDLSPRDCIALAQQICREEKSNA
jgi:hypothetical protein